MKNTQLLLILVSLSTAFAAAPDGEALYKERCGTCHDGKVQGRTPTKEEIGSRSPEFIYKAMFEGAMMAQSAGLSAEEGRAIAHYLTGKEFSSSNVVSSVGRCAGNPPSIRITDTGWNGWGDDVANTRYQPKPGLTATDVPKLKVKWAFGFAGETVRSAQATIVGGRVFVGSSSGAIYSLDASTGCIYWNYDAGATVRTAVSIGKLAGSDNYVAYFGEIGRA